MKNNKLLDVYFSEAYMSVSQMIHWCSNSKSVNRIEILLHHLYTETCKTLRPYWPSHSSKMMRAESGVPLTIVTESISPPPFLGLRKWMSSLSLSLHSSTSAGRPLTLTVRLGSAIYWDTQDRSHGRGASKTGSCPTTDSDATNDRNDPQGNDPNESIWKAFHVEKRRQFTPLLRTKDVPISSYSPSLSSSQTSPTQFALESFHKEINKAISDKMCQSVRQQ